ncbi:MAG: hypothetical protein K940chlam6_01424, partial [Chlamydiae bacterium]|nr:hypothetical protein [Chlamydiota bacterium]
MAIDAFPIQKQCHQCKITEGQLNSIGSLSTCSGCKVVHYCSKDCQKKDWSKHKLLCEKVVEVGIGGNSNKPLRIRFAPEELQTDYSGEKTFERLKNTLFGRRLGKTVTVTPISQNEASQFIEEIGGEKVVNREKFTEFKNFHFKDKRLDLLDIFIDRLEKEMEDGPNPMFYLELSMALIIKASTLNRMNGPSDELDELFAKSMVFRKIGMAFARVDVECILNDPSSKGRDELLEKTFLFKPLSGSQQKKHQEFLKKEVNKL